MKKPLLVIMLLPICYCINAGIPSKFNYEAYITPYHDQRVQGPCFVFAAIAGVEATYNMYYGKVIDLSERALWCCSGEYLDLNIVTSQLHNNGVIFESDFRYPDVPCTLIDENGIYVKNYNCTAEQNKTDRHRIKCDFTGGNISQQSNDYYKKLILQYGPIMVFLNNRSHCVLIHGWTSEGWLVKDSGPCNGVGISKLYSYSNTTSDITSVYAITGIREYVYNGSSWMEVTPVNKPFTLKYDPNFEDFTLSKPCFNSGIYTVKGLKDLGAVAESWSVDKSGIRVNKLTDSTCSITGNATNVTISVKVKRINGLREIINYNVGMIGVPDFTIEKTQGYCAGSNYEITTKLAHYAAPGINYSYSYSIPPLQNYSYVIKNGAFAYWVFKAPETVNFSATVTYSQPQCTNITSTKTSFIYSLPCGYYKAAKEEDVNNTGSDNNKPFMFPNPASNIITVNSIAAGVNTIRIFDISGNIVYNSEFENYIEIDVKNFAKGIYMIECFTKSLNKKEKLLVE